MKTCPVCGEAATDAERVCSNCGNPFPLASVREDARVVQLRERRERKEREEARRFWQQQKRQNQARRAQSSAWQYWSASPATIVLMALTVILSIAAMVGIGGLLSFSGPLELILLLFVNPSFLSLLFALFFLYIVGGQLERWVPLPLFLIVFFGSGLLGDVVEMQVGLAPIGLGPALWGMVGALYMWSRLRGFGGASTQWLTGTIVMTLVLNLFLMNFNIGQLLAQIVLAIAIGAAIVWVWTQIPGTGRMR
jgi:rhomboid protease GluP